MILTNSPHFTQTMTFPRVVPHAAQIPASDDRVVGRGELAAVVMWAPLAHGELQLPFALQGGAAGDLGRRQSIDTQLNA